VSNLAETKQGRELVDLPVASDAGHGFDQPVVDICWPAGSLIDGQGSERGPFGDGVRH
jgi:hypothetical protein